MFDKSLLIIVALLITLLIGLGVKRFFSQKAPPSAQPLPSGDMPRAVGRPWAATGTGQRHQNPYSNDE